MRLHALVADLAAAQAAVDGGATVVQLRVKGATTAELVERGARFPTLPATFVVNDDVNAAIELGADGVHLGQHDAARRKALRSGLIVGLSAGDVVQAVAAERDGAEYIGAGPVWATPSKDDADPPIGLDGLRAICGAVSLPVVAIGGVDATNAGDCIRAGAAGVAVIRAAADAPNVRRSVDDALAAR